MIEIIDRGTNDPIYKRSGPASFWFEMRIAKNGKRSIKQMRYSSGTTVSINRLVEPIDQLLWADPGTNSLRLSVAIAKGLDPTNPDNQVPNSPAWNTFVEALLLTALNEKVVIPKPSGINEAGLYADLRAADLLSEFDIDGVARFLAGLGVVENVISLADGRTVPLTSLSLPDDQPTIQQLNVISFDPLWNLIESLGFYGLMPYLWTYGLFDFKTFCDRVIMYWPDPDDRATFIFDELQEVIKIKQSTSLTDEQVSQLLNNPPTF